MQFLDSRYSKVYTYKGINICTLESVCPASGDSLGYVIDHSYFAGIEYNFVSDAVDAIEKATEQHKI